jgi:hypothetical protein
MTTAKPCTGPPHDRLTCTHCWDCGVNAWAQDEDGQIVHEDFYVHNELWDATCPDDGIIETPAPPLAETYYTVHVDGTRSVLPRTHHAHPANHRTLRSNGKFVICIGCFEQRLGRQLKPEDFKRHDGQPQDPDHWFWSDVVGRSSSARLRDRLGITPCTGLSTGHTPPSHSMGITS